MKNKNIAEIFSQSNQEAKTKHLFIEGDTIYSYGYHFPIAQKMGANLVLFNTRKYSVTTSRHQSQVKSALENTGYTLVDREL